MICSISPDSTCSLRLASKSSVSLIDALISYIFRNDLGRLRRHCVRMAFGKLKTRFASHFPALGVWFPLKVEVVLKATFRAFFLNSRRAFEFRHDQVDSKLMLTRLALEYGPDFLSHYSGSTCQSEVSRMDWARSKTPISAENFLIASGSCAIETA